MPASGRDSRPGAPEWESGAPPAGSAPGEGRTPRWRGQGPATRRPATQTCPAVLKLVVRRRVVTAWIPCALSRAAGTWGRDGTWPSCPRQSPSTRAAPWALTWSHGGFSPLIDCCRSELRVSGRTTCGTCGLGYWAARRGQTAPPGVPALGSWSLSLRDDRRGCVALVASTRQRQKQPRRARSSRTMRRARADSHGRTRLVSTLSCLASGWELGRAVPGGLGRRPSAARWLSQA